ncbi:cytochrome P450 [Mycena alexandri]|uniref:Cytochrome P450 n=1 Tax=Mycena alexandri TaxID=1745969 RepID=A0AAD6XDJ3_9AGAR|nr:cytochrome P450 [Mycena alexandri]
MFPILAFSSLTWTLIGSLALFFALRWRRSGSRLPLPPGPPQLPFVGNLLDIGSDRQWVKYLEWSQKFNSDIIHLNVLGTSIVVLSSMEAVRDLFDKRSSLYSDRPYMPMINDLMGWDFGIGRRAHRKMLHESFNVGSVKQFYPQERAATHELLRRILQDPAENVIEQFRRMAGGLIMQVTYGIEVSSAKDDPYISIAKEVMHGLSVASIPGAFLVDTIPALKYVPKWMPGAGFKRKAEEWRKVTRELLEVPFAETKRRMNMGIAPASFTSLNLDALDDSKIEEKEEREPMVKASAANLYGAGADTTVSALGTFVLAMIANPEAQKKAQAEIDSVVGIGHLPDFTDEAATPYISAIVKEVLRWRNVTPIAIPHYLTVEDEYRGYRIPAHSVVIGNAWAILHDKDMYPDPHSFKPERFLLDGKLNPAIRDPDAAFGFGRRICPGRNMATSSLWITIASVLSTFNISKATDDSGNVVELSHEYDPGLIACPLPFKCSLTPRSPQAVEAIQATMGGE